ncbi:Lysosomal Pro-X carboxypeptidase [Euphorbia peplus]|nr:Lysosomal Pro-X carboxypeptidase [Euphorbia peplus]
MYSSAAQYNRAPRFKVNSICKAIDDGGNNDTLSKIFGGVVADQGNKSCYIYQPIPSETSIGWRWQTCSEMVIPIGRGNETMFPPYPFNLTAYIDECMGSYGVAPRPHWITTYYGGHSIKLILQRFGSNIIFSNGLRDPYSSGGVLENLSDTILAVSTTNGSHCLDIVNGNEITDPEWLVAQRQSEIKIIEGWINKYYDDLLHINTTNSAKML